MSQSSTSTIARGALYMCTAVVLWGTVGGLVGVMGQFTFGLSLGAAITLGIVLAWKRINPVPALRQQPWLFGAVAALVALNDGGYYLAITLGPPSVVTSIHMTSPIVLGIIMALRSRGKDVHWTLAIEIAFIVGALAVIAVKPWEGQWSTTSVWTAIAIAIFTVFAVLGLNLLVSKLSSGVPSAVGAFWQMLGSLPILALLAVTTPFPGWSVAATMTVLGSTLFAAAMLLFWRAMALAPVRLVSTIGLGEVSTLTAAFSLMTWTLPDSRAVIAACLILCAVLVNMRFANVSTKPSVLSADDDPGTLGLSQ